MCRNREHILAKIKYITSPHFPPSDITIITIFHIYFCYPSNFYSQCWVHIRIFWAALKSHDGHAIPQIN